MSPVKNQKTYNRYGTTEKACTTKASNKYRKVSGY